MSESEKLPDGENAWVEEKKVKEYLLNLAHVDGSPKAKYFMKRGFTLERWEVMRDALVQQGRSNPVVEMTDHPYGRRYIVECSCPTPDKLDPCIRSVWETAEPEKQPRLITAHVI